MRCTSSLVSLKNAINWTVLGGKAQRDRVVGRSVAHGSLGLATACTTAAPGFLQQCVWQQQFGSGAQAGVAGQGVAQSAARRSHGELLSWSVVVKS